ncbi:hypothetical protein K3728_18375 [Rhodobacteraceae bacterium M385]|nr:hypothetical protein K3728_18375 [Rhodobacteraceae bacterium M385]
MGLALDGFVNPVEGNSDDTSPDDGADAGDMETPETGSGLTDLLDAEEEEISDDAPESARAEAAELEAAETAEAAADSDWTRSEPPEEDSAFVEISATADVEGETVAYVEYFSTDTDTLVLEFDGTADEAPAIDVEHDTEEDATLVFANGLPVTLVDGTTPLTEDHVRVVMSEEGDTPATSPTATDETGERAQSPDVPQTLPLTETPSPSEGRDPGSDGPLIQVEDPLPRADEPSVVVTEPANEDLLEANELDTILDQITKDLTGIGGTNEMLQARVDIDAAFGTGGDDALTGTFNSDELSGGDGAGTLYGDEGNDTLYAGGGNDELYGGSGADDLQGETGVDFLNGGEGNDTLDGGSDRDLLFGGEGDDVLHGGGANDFLQGGMGYDTLNGGSGDDTLDGTFGDGSNDQDDADVLWGGSGDDHIILGQGDLAVGGAGSDTFTGGSYIESAEVAGRVADFDPSEDRIEVIFDPSVNPDPTLEVQDFADGSGANIILNGEIILSVEGAQGLDPNAIVLQSVA